MIRTESGATSSSSQRCCWATAAKVSYSAARTAKSSTRRCALSRSLVGGEVGTLVGEHAGRAPRRHSAGRSCRRVRWRDRDRSSCRHRSCWTHARVSRRRRAPRESWSERPASGRCRPCDLGCDSWSWHRRARRAGHVVGGQHHLGATGAAAHCHGTVGVGRGDDEAVAVLHPALSVVKQAVVLAGHDLVTDARPLAVRDRKAASATIPSATRPSSRAGSAR
jgi:hypothetical protein